MKYLVTGGAGFIGSHIVDRLVDDGHTVTVIDNLSTGRRENLARSIQKITLEVCDIQSLECREVIADFQPNVIFHQAAAGSVPRSIKHPFLVHETNVTGSLNVLHAARKSGVRRVIVASSSSVYGDTEGTKLESQVLAPMSPYAASKVAMEAYCQAWSRAHLLETICLRYFNIYGPRQNPEGEYAAVIPRFIEAARHDDPMIIFGDGEQTRDFTFVDDVVMANAFAATAPLGTSRTATMNISMGHRVTINQLASYIHRLVGKGGAAKVEHVGVRLGDVRHSLAGTSLARVLIDFEPMIDIEPGLARTVASFL